MHEPENFEGSGLKEVMVLASGGLESTTLLYYLKSQGVKVHMVFIDYGQKFNAQEHMRVTALASAVKAESFTPVFFDEFATLFTKCALTDDGRKLAVPKGEYGLEEWKTTLIPNRNMVLISIGLAVAIEKECQAVAYGASQNIGSFENFPDSRPVFADAMNVLASLCHTSKLELLAPFKRITKTDVVRWGLKHSVPYELTWSCWEGGEIPCGSCGQCLSRAKAFHQIGRLDPALGFDIV